NDRDLQVQLLTLLLDKRETGEAMKKQLAEAQTVLKQLREGKAHPVVLEFFDARLDYAGEGEDWKRGLVHLERIRPQLAAWPDLARQADLILGQGYERLGNPDRQLLLLRRVVASAPFLPSARLYLASRLLEQGRVDEALQECRQLEKLQE